MQFCVTQIEKVMIFGVGTLELGMASFKKQFILK